MQYRRLRAVTKSLSDVGQGGERPLAVEPPCIKIIRRRCKRDTDYPAGNTTGRKQTQQSHIWKPPQPYFIALGLGAFTTNSSNTSSRSLYTFIFVL